MSILTNRIKKCDSTSETFICPQCKNEGNFDIFTSSEYLSPAGIPLFPVHSEYYCICPSCKGYFKINSENPKDFSALKPDDLEFVKTINGI